MKNEEISVKMSDISEEESKLMKKVSGKKKQKEPKMKMLAVSPDVIADGKGNRFGQPKHDRFHNSIFLKCLGKVCNYYASEQLNDILYL
jgi:hypothetical protein